LQPFNKWHDLCVAKGTVCRGGKRMYHILLRLLPRYIYWYQSMLIIHGLSEWSYKELKCYHSMLQSIQSKSIYRMLTSRVSTKMSLTIDLTSNKKSAKDLLSRQAPTSCYTRASSPSQGPRTCARVHPPLLEAQLLLWYTPTQAGNGVEGATRWTSKSL
jgi:hypothetical protein